MPPVSLEPSLRGFVEANILGPAVGLRVTVEDRRSEVPVHRHRQGQLVLALRGAVTCEVPRGIWMVPPSCAVWVPGGMPHSIRATANASICYLFVQPLAAPLPDECCTLAISPLVRELVLHMADEPSDYPPDSPAGRKAAVLLEELVRMPVQHLHLPTTEEPTIRKIAAVLVGDPADRRTLAQWGQAVAMSERSLARLVRRETGLTFGRWRRQLHLIVALRQLAAGQSIQRVADELGYESVTAFITMFKQALGKPPAKYFASINASNASPSQDAH
jgi:AraC-like DNA-binding protein/quercetin dioxygenase-like cupin family protein